MTAISVNVVEGEDAQKHAAHVPAYRDAPDDVVTAFASSITT